MTDTLKEYEIILRDGSKRFEFAGSLKDLRILIWMHDGVSARPVKKGATQ